MLNFFIVALLIVAVDQASKAWVLAHMTVYEKIHIIPHLNFSLGFNRGAAFGFLSTAGGWQRWAFIGLALVIIGFVIGWATHLKPREKFERFALACILGGAIGNLIDRLVRGHVVDFFDFYVQEWHWYTFNIADIGISAGAVILLWLSFRK